MYPYLQVYSSHSTGQIPLSKAEGLVSALHRNSLSVTRWCFGFTERHIRTIAGSGRSDKQPVLIQSCRISSVFRCTVLSCVAVQEPHEAEAGVCELSLFGPVSRSALAHKKFTIVTPQSQVPTGVGSGCTAPTTPQSEAAIHPLLERQGLSCRDACKKSTFS